MGAGAPERLTDAEKKGDWVDLLLENAQKKSPPLEVSEYPEDVVPVLVEFQRLWKVNPPSKRVDSGAYKLWIRECRAVKSACAEFGLSLMHRYHRRWEKEGRKLTIARPGSLVNLLHAEAGLARQEQSDRQKPVGIEGYDPQEVADFQAKLKARQQARLLENAGVSV